MVLIDNFHGMAVKRFRDNLECLFHSKARQNFIRRIKSALEPGTDSADNSVAERSLEVLTSSAKVLSNTREPRYNDIRCSDGRLPCILERECK